MSALTNRWPRGFTLLEMLLVVFIMSAMALTTTAFVDNQDDQFRYEDTRRRLASIRRAIVGDPTAVHAGQAVLSGYAVDNGVLPGALLSMKGVVPPTGFLAGGQHAPVFDANPNGADGLNNGGGETLLNAAGEQLEKGWVAGRLQTAPGSAGEFRDGWGTKASNGVASPILVASNDGWQWIADATGSTLSVTSLGRDRKDASSGGGTDAYDADMDATLGLNDWTVPLSSISVRVKAAADFPGPSAPPYLRVSLLVFRNDASTARWRRYTTTSNAVTCMDGTRDGLVNGSPCALTETQLTFAPHSGYTAPWDTRVPIGRHLLVLVKDENTSIHDGETPYVTTSSATRIVQPIHCFASGCTTETLILLP